METLTPHMARITLGGPALDDFFVEQPGEIITLLWPADGEELVLPGLGWTFPPGTPEDQHARNYTVRAWDPDTRELTIDFVLHGDEGRASAWALRAQPGRHGRLRRPARPLGALAPDADWTLLVADETGLPALAAIVESLPAGHRSIALVEVAGPDEQQVIETAANLDLSWLHRGEGAPGTGRALESALRDLHLSGGQGACGARANRRRCAGFRRHLRAGRLMAASSLSILGYWVRSAEEAK